MQPFEFSLGIKGLRNERRAGSENPTLTSDYFVTPETIPGRLLSSRARFRFVSHINRKPALGLSLKRKPIGGLTI